MDLKSPYLALFLHMCYNKPRMVKIKEATTANKPEKPLTELKTFMENINKKDKLNGKRVNFGFTKRKRKH